MKDILNKLYKYNKRIKAGESLSDEEREEFITLFEAAQKFIGSIDNDYTSTCLTERYINVKPWHEIADEMGQLTNDAVRKCCSRAIARYM